MTTHWTVINTIKLKSLHNKLDKHKKKETKTIITKKYIVSINDKCLVLIYLQINSFS